MGLEVAVLLELLLLRWGVMWEKLWVHATRAKHVLPNINCTQATERAE